jgi:CO/xanthine dehydrogenase Mo-binding subunit
MSFLQSRTRLAREGFGKPVLRKEDARLLVGARCYSDDVRLPGQGARRVEGGKAARRRSASDRCLAGGVRRPA